MCWECHQNLSDEDVKACLDQITEADFDEWNSTSLNHLYIIAAGVNGPENKELAFYWLDKFMKYAISEENKVNWLQRKLFGVNLKGFKYDKFYGTTKMSKIIDYLKRRK
jgi:hypothetical protein